jgi:hypothetical protein
MYCGTEDKTLGIYTTPTAANERVFVDIADDVFNGDNDITRDAHKFPRGKPRLMGPCDDWGYWDVDKDGCLSVHAKLYERTIDIRVEKRVVEVELPVRRKKSRGRRVGELPQRR